MSSACRYKDTGGDSFFGLYLYESVIPQNHFIRALKLLFDWEALGRDLIRHYERKDRSSPLSPDDALEDALLVLPIWPLGARHRALRE